MQKTLRRVRYKKLKGKMSCGIPVKYGKACQVTYAMRLNMRNSGNNNGDDRKHITNLTLKTIKSKFHFVS
jgi:hypothetical protein